jgi:hypothetical protein
MDMVPFYNAEVEGLLVLEGPEESAFFTEDNLMLINTYLMFKAE